MFSRTTILIAIITLVLAVSVGAQPITSNTVHDVAASFMGFESNGTPVYALLVHLGPHDASAGGGFVLAYTCGNEGVMKPFWRYSGRSTTPTWVTKTLRVPAWFGPTFRLHLCLDTEGPVSCLGTAPGGPVIYTLPLLQKPDFFSGLEPYGFVNTAGNGISLHASRMDPGAGVVGEMICLDVCDLPPYAYGCLVVAPCQCATPFGRNWIWVGPEYAFVLPLLFQADKNGQFEWNFVFPPALYGAQIHMQAVSHDTRGLLMSNGMKIKVLNPDGRP